MAPISWNSDGVHLIDALPKSQTFNATYYVNIIIQPLLDGHSNGPDPGLMIPADNATPRTARKPLKFLSGKSPGNRATSTILTGLSAI
jgi:hypothetical protein